MLVKEEEMYIKRFKLIARRAVSAVAAVEFRRLIAVVLMASCIQQMALTSVLAVGSAVLAVWADEGSISGPRGRATRFPAANTKPQVLASTEAITLGYSKARKGPSAKHELQAGNGNRPFRNPLKSIQGQLQRYRGPFIKTLLQKANRPRGEPTCESA